MSPRRLPGVDLDVPAPAAPDRSARAFTDPLAMVRRQAGPVGAALVVAVVGTIVLVRTGTDPVDVGRYLVVWVGLIMLPGLLLWRAVMGRSTTEIELGGGAAVGIAVLLVCWLAATGLGRPLAAALVPVGVLVAFTVHPRLRPCWRPRSSLAGRRRLAWWWSMAGLGVVMEHFLSLAILRPTILPPGPTQISPDAWYYLGISRQLALGFPPADPTFVGGLIRYHWFGIGLITATSQLAGTDLVATNFHLWFVPFVIAWMLVVAALVRTLLSRQENDRPAARWWCWGPVGACLVVVAPVAVSWAELPVPGLGTGLNSASASGAFGALFVSALGLVIVVLLRGDHRPGVWVLAVLLTVAAAGIKPTVLPVVAAGCLLAAAWQLLRRSSGRPIGLAVGAGMVLVFSIAGRVVVGSSTGTGLQPFAIVVDDPGYRSLFGSGHASLPGAGGSVLPAIAEGRPGATTFAIAVLVLFLAGQALPLLGIGWLPFSSWRRDPGAVWVAGAVLSGYAATFLIKHSGFSQQWFALDVTGTGIALAVAVVATSIEVPDRRTAGRVVGALVVAFGCGGCLAAGWRWVGPPVTAAGPPPATWLRLLGYGSLAVLVAAALLVARGWRRRGGPELTPVVVVASILVGASLPASTGWLVANTVVPITQNPAAIVSVSEQEAALWLRAHTSSTDVVVSNVFCRPVVYREGCDHSTVWVSALTGRRLVLDGWAYIPQTMQHYDGTTLGPRMPSPFPGRLADSLAVVRQGSAAAACRLRRQFGASWVYADAGATAVSPRLDRFADLRYRAGPVSVFRIDPSRLDCAGR